MGYVPPSERTTAWWLFNKLFYVRVNPHKIRSVEDILAYGTPTTGNENYDRELTKSEEMVMLNIAQMEDVFNNGYPVNIVKYEDTNTIYELITNHLVHMRSLLTFSENVNNDPKTLDELIRLDKFAAVLFEHARHGLRADVSHSPLVKRMAADRFGSLGALGRRRNATPEVAQPLATDGAMGRDYSTGGDVQKGPPKEPAELEKIDDPTLPKRISLERLFEDQKRLGMRWN